MNGGHQIVDKINFDRLQWRRRPMFFFPSHLAQGKGKLKLKSDAVLLQVECYHSTSRTQGGRLLFVRPRRPCDRPRDLIVAGDFI
jgi:hypothetical protein